MALTASGRYRLFAVCPSRPGFVIVEDAEGQHRLFISKNGQVTRKPLDPNLVAALAEHPNWTVVEDGRWYSLDELRKLRPPASRQTVLDESVPLDTIERERMIEEWSD